MSLSLRPSVPPTKTDRAILTLTNSGHGYSPGRTIVYSLLVHAVFFNFVLLFSVVQSPVGRFPLLYRSQEVDLEGEFLTMFLPPIGGGQAGGDGQEAAGGAGGGDGTEAPEGPPAPAPGPGSGGMLFPGPQIIRSDFAAPTNNQQTLLQPDLEDLPVLDEPIDLPNLLSIPEPESPPERPVREEQPVEPSEETPEELAPQEVENLPVNRPPAEPNPNLMPLPNLPDQEPPPEPEIVEPEPEPEPLDLSVEDLPVVRETPDEADLFAAPDVRPIPRPDPEDLAIGLADPDKPEEQQPLDPTEGKTLEPLQLEVAALPVEGRPPEETELLSNPEPEDLEPEPTEEPVEDTEPVEETAEETDDAAETVEELAEPLEEAAEPVESTVVDLPTQSQPEDLPLGSTRETTPGTDLPNILALTPMPKVTGEPLQIPAAEAHGQFTISPNASLETVGSEAGLPSVVTIGESTPGPGGGNPDSDALPSMVTISFGPSGGAGGEGEGLGEGPEAPGEGTGSGSGEGSGTGSGSGPGRGSGTGTGTGTGSGAGSGPGEGPFAGITTIGGFGNSATAASAGSGRNEGPLSGFTIVGGVGESGGTRGRTTRGGTGGAADVSGTPVMVTRTLTPDETRYGWSVVSTESAGGGLPYVGVFLNEQIQTVYLDMRESPTDSAPFWPFEFAVPRETVTQMNLPKKPEETDPPDPAGQGEEGSENEPPATPEETTETSEVIEGEKPDPAPETVEPDPTKGFILPAPIAKVMPGLPPGLVSLYQGKMVTVFAVINVEGRLEQMSVKDSPDSRLNAPVLAAMSKWVFRPGLLNNEPVAVQTLFGVPVR